MKYIHKELLGKNLIKRWCNEVETASEEGYEERVWKIHKIGTEEYYDDPIDLTNEERERRGLEPYYYEPTDIPVEKEEPDEE